MLDAALVERCAFGAHQRGVTHILQSDAALVTFGLDTDGGGAPVTTMCVWAARTAECIRHVHFGAVPAVAAVGVAPGGRLICVGASDGSVWLLRTAAGLADTGREPSPRFRRLSFVGAASLAGEPITGLHFGGGGEGHVRGLFITTSRVILSLGLGGLSSGTGGAEPGDVACRVLSDGGGADAGCSCVSLDASGSPAELAVGRSAVEAPNSLGSRPSLHNPDSAIWPADATPTPFAPHAGPRRSTFIIKRTRRAPLRWTALSARSAGIAATWSSSAARLGKAAPPPRGCRSTT